MSGTRITQREAFQINRNLSNWDPKPLNDMSDGVRRVGRGDVAAGQALQEIDTTVDRATFGETRIGRGTKIDNLVQIAHNVVIGEFSVVVAQVGISGSVTVGKDAILAGQAGPGRSRRTRRRQ